MSSSRSKFLVDEPPLLVFPSLARALGLLEGMLLQQLHYWLHIKAREPGRYADHFIDDRYWVHWTMAELQERVPFGASSKEPYVRVTRRLRNLGILLVAQHGSAWDRTNWYSIDYEVFDRTMGSVEAGRSSIGGNPANGCAGLSPMRQRQSRPSSAGEADEHCLGTETSTKTTTTAEDVVVVDAEVTSRTGMVGPPPLADLDLRRIPEWLRAGVAERLARNVHGQRFVVLLAERLERPTKDPKVGPLQNPLLWLDSLLETKDKVDFSVAARIAETFQTEEARQLRVTAQAAKDAESERQAKERLTLRVRNAQEAVNRLSVEDRKALAEAASTKCRAPKVAAVLRSSLADGRVPTSPLPLMAIEDALRQQALLHEAPREVM